MAQATWNAGGLHGRDVAWNLLVEHNQSDSLRKHGLAVEASMRGLARRYGEDEDVVHAIEAHHNEVPPQTIEAVLTQASDACWMKRTCSASSFTFGTW